MHWVDEHQEGSDELNLRQKEILKLVVSGYIQMSQPVSSLFIARKYRAGLSSATIRSIFSDLEEKGYLFSPHRSAGRVPTEKGYRLYVDQLPERLDLAEEDRRLIQKEYLKREFQLVDILEVNSRILSMLTDYAGVVLSPEPEQSVLKHIELIDMGQDEVLVVLVTRSGTVYSKILSLENRIPADYLQKISRYLNETLKGCDLREIRSRLEEESEGGEMVQYFPMIARTITANFDLVKGEEQLFTSGLDNLYTQVAQGQMERIKGLGNLFDTGDPIRSIFKKTLDLDGLVVLINGDRDNRLDNLSIVTGSYKMGEKRIGAIGVIGPNRMDYVRVLSIVEYTRALISNMITKLSN